jgi:hypothetical protein
MTMDRNDGSRWEAPRLAYELTAACAEAAASGGGGGLPPGAARAWGALTAGEQHDTADALRSQARAALYLLQSQVPGLAGDLGGRPSCLEAVCAHSRQDAEALTCLVPGVPWTLPPCPGCAAACAAALCEIQYRAYEQLGFPAAQVAAEFAALAADAPAAVLFIPVPRDRTA